jgi:hypothetical protein
MERPKLSKPGIIFAKKTIAAKLAGKTICARLERIAWIVFWLTLLVDNIGPIRYFLAFFKLGCASKKAVSTTPGQTVVTPTSNGASSYRKALPIAIMANFEAEYAAREGSAINPAIEAKLTMCPNRRFRMSGAKAKIP